MVMGFDVTHPSPNSSSRAPSVAVLTVIIGPGQGQCVSVSRIQKRGQEVTDIGEMFKDLLPLWKTVGKHGRFPENILLYRDGVGDGQQQMVVNHEVRLLRKASEEMYGRVSQETPRITTIIVNKRHHTRFGPTTTETADDNGNCLAGTVTDRGITEAGQWDFFLRKSALHSSSRVLNLSRCTHIDPQSRIQRFREQLVLLTTPSSTTRSFVAVALLQATPLRTLWRTLLKAYTTHLGDAREPCLSAPQLITPTSSASAIAFTLAACSTPPRTPIRLL